MFDVVVTQRAFADLVGVSEAAVSQMVAEGIIDKGDTLQNWCRAYCGRLREQAAGRYSGETFDLAEQRARLAAEQADKVAMQNAQTRRELAPVALLELVLARTAGRVASILDGIAPEIKRRIPGMPSAEFRAIQEAVAKARNAAGAMKLDDAFADDEGADPAADTEPLIEV